MHDPGLAQDLHDDRVIMLVNELHIQLWERTAELMEQHGLPPVCNQEQSDE
jgi:hypothetical protein